MQTHTGLQSVGPRDLSLYLIASVSLGLCLSLRRSLSVSVSRSLDIVPFVFLFSVFGAAADLCCLPEYVSFYHQCWRTLLVVRNGCVMFFFVDGLVWRHILNAERNQ